MKHFITITLGIVLTTTLAQNPMENLQGIDRANSQINDSLNSFFGEGSGATVTPEAAAVDGDIFTYEYNPQVSEEVRKLFVDTLTQAGVVADVEALQLGLQQITPDVMQEFVDSIFPGEGFKANNMVDVIAMSIISNFFIVQQLDQTTVEADLAVRDLFKVAFSNTPKLTALSDAEKQLFSELFMLSLMFLANDLQQAQQGSPGYAMEDVIAGATQNLQGFGLDPRLLELTDTGLKPTQLSKDIEAGKTTIEESLPDLYALMQEQNVKPIVPNIDTQSSEPSSSNPLDKLKGPVEPSNP